jgi:hypothetical protein
MVRVRVRVSADGGFRRTPCALGGVVSGGEVLVRSLWGHGCGGELRALQPAT